LETSALASSTWKLTIFAAETVGNAVISQ